MTPCHGDLPPPVLSIISEEMMPSASQNPPAPMPSTSGTQPALLNPRASTSRTTGTHRLLTSKEIIEGKKKKAEEQQKKAKEKEARAKALEEKKAAKVRVEAIDNDLCAICDGEEDEDEVWVQCNRCHRWMHVDCIPNTVDTRGVYEEAYPFVCHLH